MGHVTVGHVITLSCHLTSCDQSRFISDYRIDHWDNEKERLVLLNDNSLLCLKYDFVACKLLEFKRIMLKVIDKVNYGVFEYPEKTIAT